MFVYECVIRYTCVLVYQRVGLVACCSGADSFVRSEPVIGDLDPIWIRARYGPDTQEIRIHIYGMIRRLVLVRTVKTRW